MNTTLVVRSLALSLFVALPLAAPARAQLPDPAVDCRAAVAKNFAKLMKTAHKTIASCHKSRDTGKLPDTTDCNDMAEAEGAKQKFTSSRNKAEGAIEAACAGQDAVLTSLGSPPYYSTCPVPCGGVPDPMTTMSQVADCLGCYAEAVAEDVGAATLGQPVPTSLSKADVKCRGALAKGYGKYAATAYKEETSCQRGQDAVGNHDPAGCAGSDPKLKVSKTLTKADAGLDKSCAAAALAALDSCAADTVGNLKACSAAAFGDAEDDLFLATYAMAQSPFCPSTVRLTQLAGCSTLEPTAGGCSSGGETTSSLSEGWKPSGHDSGVVDAVTLALDVTCPGTPGACGTCTVDGISSNNPAFDGFARCHDTPWVECTNLFGLDAACGGGPCAYFASPPVPFVAGGAPLCVLSQYDDQVSGAVDPDAGDVDLTLEIRTRLHSGLGISQPCPVCRNDATPQDGVAAGTCDGGPRNGLGCDAQGFDLSFAATNADAPTQGLSLDCPPSAVSGFTGSGYARTFVLTTGATTLPAGDACDMPLGSLDCFCGVCSVDPTVVCNGDSDCSGLGLGTCGAGSGSSRQPNACGDLTCEPTGSPDGRGECTGDFELYCDGLLRADGKGILPCFADFQCDAFVTGSPNPEDWICPGDDCGSCAHAETRSCFVDPIALSGTASATAPVIAGATCVPPTTSTSVDAVFGLPGPSSLVLETVLQPMP